MGDDYRDIPRRLRRFYRKGEPVPPEAQPRQAANSSHEEEEPAREPWEDAHAESLPQKTRHRRENRGQQETPPLPSARFEKMVDDSQKPAVTTMDHALGLSQKAAFAEKLPGESHHAIVDHPGKKEEIEHTLRELKELASLGNPKDANTGPASFHFTPAGGAPTPPSAIEKAMGEKKTSPSLPNASLTPRERMEQRRQGKGMPLPEGEKEPPASPITTPAKPSIAPLREGGSSHYRRRMGELSSPEKEDSQPSDSPTPERDSPQEEMGDFRDLLDDSASKKKKKKPVDEEDDLSLDEEMPLFEDEK